MTTREEDIQKFLKTAGWGDCVRKPLAGDASARRYERVSSSSRRAVLMDADPAKGESVDAFVRVTRHLRGLGLSAPEIYSADADRGFLLIEDLGDDLFARHVQKRPDEEMTLYLAATDVLIALHRQDLPTDVPDYVSQMALLAGLAYEWYANGILGEAPARGAFDTEMNAVVAQLDPSSRALVLRDYHAENLIWLPHRNGEARVGLLDYQDAMAGPRAYDLVSLIKDARRDVSPDTAKKCSDHYAKETGIDVDAFRLEMAICSAQRNLRILGVFARLSLRDGKPGYLKWIPRVWHHLLDDLSHPSLLALRKIVLSDLPEPTSANLARLDVK